MPPPVEGLRAPLREPAGIRGEASRATGPGVSEARTNAGRLPVPAQAGGEGVNSMKNNGLIISMTYESNSKASQLQTEAECERRRWLFIRLVAHIPASFVRIHTIASKPPPVDERGPFGYRNSTFRAYQVFSTAAGWWNSSPTGQTPRDFVVPFTGGRDQHSQGKRYPSGWMGTRRYMIEPGVRTKRRFRDPMWPTHPRLGSLTTLEFPAFCPKPVVFSRKMR